jgi:SAM-dependent methyltransferase
MSVSAQVSRSRKYVHRTRLAREFLIGHGIEIGALANPVPAPNGHVLYLDRWGLEALREIYPAEPGLIAPDCIDDAQTLATFEDASLDFVVACQVIEYCGDVLAALQSMCRVLRPGGILFLSVADMRQTPDRRRPVTPLGHLAADYVHGPAGSWAGHLQEWAALNEDNPVSSPDIASTSATQLLHIRQHLWTPAAWMELLIHVQDGFGLELQALRLSHKEILTVLRKQTSAHRS